MELFAELYSLRTYINSKINFSDYFNHINKLTNTSVRGILLRIYVLINKVIQDVIDLLTKICPPTTTTTPTPTPTSTSTITSTLTSTLTSMASSTKTAPTTNPTPEPQFSILSQYYDPGDQQYHSYNVSVYVTKGNRDSFVGGGNISKTETVKSIIDSYNIKCKTCIVSSGKQYVKSLDGINLYTTLHELKLKYDKVELFIID